MSQGKNSFTLPDREGLLGRLIVGETSGSEPMAKGDLPGAASAGCFDAARVRGLAPMRLLIETKTFYRFALFSGAVRASGQSMCGAIRQ